MVFEDKVQNTAKVVLPTLTYYVVSYRRPLQDFKESLVTKRYYLLEQPFHFLGYAIYIDLEYGKTPKTGRSAGNLPTKLL
jgi:hypothetical protein